MVVLVVVRIAVIVVIVVNLLVVGVVEVVVAGLVGMAAIESHGGRGRKRVAMVIVLWFMVWVVV